VGKNREMGDLSDFVRGQSVGARLVGASVTTDLLLGVSRVTVLSTVTMACTDRRKTTYGKRNSGRK
jgi:hypothetical protein